MRLYKFRQLGNKKDYERVKVIIETGCFWCSSFSELNDPMEGTFHASNEEEVMLIYNEKTSYKICSFSGEGAFKRPSIWGYYTNGFRGVAIEIDVLENEIPQGAILRNIDYVKNTPTVKYISDTETQKILTTKLNSWKSENEYRFLTDSQSNYHKIGKVTAIYFGHPYSNALNRELIYKNSLLLKEYDSFKERLINLLIDKKIMYHEVKVLNNQVIYE